MTSENPTQPVDGSSEPKPAASRYVPLRVWPALLLIVAMVVLHFLPSIIKNGPPQIWMSTAFGPALCGLVMVIWWLAASKATWGERVIGFVGIVAAFAATMLTLHKTMMGPTISVITIPAGMAAFAIGAILMQGQLSMQRTIVAILLAFLGFGFSSLLRNEGMWGNFAPDVDWRWVQSEEEKLVADVDKSFVSISNPETLSAALTNPQWPAFRGADRSGRQVGLDFETDWEANPPKLLWKRSVGPAWSSFSVAGQLLFTQEQRGEQEAVTCYSTETGEPIWEHTVEARFDDPLGGPGPRATPTIAGGFLYAMGANGFLLKLDPKTGELIWKTDIREKAGRAVPMWGFCSSPLVVDGKVIVMAGGTDGEGTLAFDAATGDLKWNAGSGNHTYSSPHPIRLLGQDFVAALSNEGMNVIAPDSGESKLNYLWEHGGYRALQPVSISDSSLIIPTGLGEGTRLVEFEMSDGKLKANEVWTTMDLKSDFNDMVLYEGYLYGFDGTILTCIEVESGERMWKGGRYGNGQMMLLEKAGLLLVVSEKGECVLVNADSDDFEELTRFQAIEGKTWNHPVVIGDRLYVRNAEEAACYILPQKSEE